MYIAKFEKVSFEQFKEDCQAVFGSFEAAWYEDLCLPKRATKGSAGYDFTSPMDVSIKPNELIRIPSGIRVRIEEGYVLNIYPRSSLGFKYQMTLANTTGIIDSDYYGSDNEGHIFIKITNDSNENKIVSVKMGEGFAQGIFLEYGICEDDDVCEIRNGGFGSTTK